tara:strand:+ start:6169 stop:6270 length:102 start_codon:yes stop_codon:yes gene_type:complete
MKSEKLNNSSLNKLKENATKLFPNEIDWKTKKE